MTYVTACRKGWPPAQDNPHIRIARMTFTISDIPSSLPARARIYTTAQLSFSAVAGVAAAVSCHCAPMRIASTLLGLLVFVLLGFLPRRSQTYARFMAGVDLTLALLIATQLQSSSSVFLLLALAFRLALTLPNQPAIVTTALSVFIGPAAFALQHDFPISRPQTLGNVIGFAVGYLLAATIVHAVIQIDRAYVALGIAHDELRKYAARVEETAALRERTRITRDLHDSLGHDLTVLTIQLEGAVKYATVNTSRSFVFVDLALASARALLERVRATVTTLATDPLQREDFEPLIASLCERFSFGSTISVQSDIQCTVSDTEMKTAVYRVVQELLTNVAKHAGASNVRVHVYQDEQHLRLAVQDDGIGFNPADQSSGYGLRGIRERVHQFAGNVSVRSSAGGAGTCVSVDIPMRPQ